MVIKKFKRCLHVHYSGRRCGLTTSRKDQRCGLHKVEGDKWSVCQECQAMMAAFPIRRMA